jgi:predicted Zn-dependent peptidase
VRKNGLDRATLDRARVKMRSDLYASLEQFAGFGKANLLASFALFDDDPGRINRLEDEFAKVTTAVVQKTAAEYLRPANRTVYLIKPGKTGQPSPESK